MMTKTTVVSLFALSLLALTGIGYATFTSYVTISGNASAGNVNLYFYSSTPNTPPGTYATCTWSGSTGSAGDNTLTLTVSNLSPGDYCGATAEVANAGSLPATSETTTIGGETGYICTTSGEINCMHVIDNYGLDSEGTISGTGSSTICASNACGINEVVTVGMPAGSTYQSISGTFTITFTGSVGS